MRSFYSLKKVPTIYATSADVPPKRIVSVIDRTNDCCVTFQRKNPKIDNAIAVAKQEYAKMAGTCAKIR